MLYRNKSIISPVKDNKDRFNMKISEILKHFNIKSKDKVIEFQIDNMSEDFELPNIKYFINN